MRNCQTVQGALGDPAFHSHAPARGKYKMTSIAKQSYKQNYTDNVELSIFNCGHEYCEPGHTWGPGVRDHYLIHLVVAGKGVYQVGGSAFTLEEGDLFLAKPNQLITYAADETDPWEYYWVGFNGACANKLVQQAPFMDNRPVHHCKNPQKVREALYNIYLARGPEPQCEALMTGYLYIFMAYLMEEARKVAEEALEKCQRRKIKDWNNMKSQVRDSLSSYIYDRTKRSPIILPVFLEV